MKIFSRWVKREKRKNKQFGWVIFESLSKKLNCLGVRSIPDSRDTKLNLSPNCRMLCLPSQHNNLSFSLCSNNCVFTGPHWKISNSMEENRQILVKPQLLKRWKLQINFVKLNNKINFSIQSSLLLATSYTLVQTFTAGMLPVLGSNMWESMCKNACSILKQTSMLTTISSVEKQTSPTHSHFSNYIQGYSWSITGFTWNLMFCPWLYFSLNKLKSSQ